MNTSPILVRTCKAGRLSVWTPGFFHQIANQPNRWILQDILSRTRFFKNGGYSYRPSDEYLKAYAKFKLHAKN